MTHRFEKWRKDFEHENSCIPTLSESYQQGYSDGQAAQAQAAEPTIQEAIDAGDGCLHSTIDSLQDKVAQQQAAMRLALEALRELADCGAEAWSAERPCVKDGYAAIAALEGVL